MSAAEHQSPKQPSHGNDKSSNIPPQRPSLRKPPARPERSSSQETPQAQAAETPSRPSHSVAPPQVPTTKAADTAESSSPAPRRSVNHPIAPPSEPMQYRAIGLVKGVYEPTEEQINRGNIHTDDGAVIDAVVLGRVTSLIKKHVDLESSHLWVVYPRTRQPMEATDDTEATEDYTLHLQIVGVWEPDTLGLPGQNPHSKDDDAADDEESDTAPVDGSAADAEASSEAPETSENYFSIRGEVLNYNEEKGDILVKIVQGAKRSGKPPKAFKLNLFGQISGKILGYFWEFEVERQGEKLIVTEGRAIRMVPPKKKKKGRSLGPRRGRPSGAGDRSKPTRHSDKPRIRPSAPVKSNPL